MSINDDGTFPKKRQAASSRNTVRYKPAYCGVLGRAMSPVNRLGLSRNRIVIVIAAKHEVA